MFKNVASQVLTVLAIDTATGLPKTGDAANIVLYVDKDNAGVNAISSNSGVPTEIDAVNSKGRYKIALTQSETNADKLDFSGVSSTSGIEIIPLTIYTLPANFTKSVIDSSGLQDANVVKVGPSGSGVAQTAADLAKGSYMLGAVWLDTVNGTAGTTSYINGIATNPTNLIASAITIATAIGVKRLHILNGSSVTLAATLANYTVDGDGYTLALGGQDISSSIFMHFGLITGIATGTSPIFDTGLFGAATLPPCVVLNSGLSGTITVGSAGNYIFVDCHSQTSGTSVPIIDMGSLVGATDVKFRRYSGGLSVTNVKTGDTVSIDCCSGGDITINGTGGNVYIRGIVRSVTDSSGGAVIIDSVATINQIVIATPTNITAGTISTVTNLTNAPTNGDFTATMKTSIGTAVAASPVASVTGNVGGNVTGSVGSVSGNVGGNVVGSVGSISGVSFPTNFGAANIDSSGRVLLQPTQSGVTIPTVTTLTNAPTISALAANTITTASIADAAITSAKIGVTSYTGQGLATYSALGIWEKVIAMWRSAFKKKSMPFTSGTSINANSNLYADDNVTVVGKQDAVDNGLDTQSLGSIQDGP